MSDDGLSLRLELTGGLAGTAIVANDRTDAVSLWRPGSELGDAPLRFELTHGKASARFFSDAVYTRNTAVAVSVAPGGTLERPFDLEDGDWRVEGEAEAGPGAQLVAVYDVPLTSEAAEHGVWVGTLRSDPVALA